MTPPDPRSRARSGDEELRYRATGELDPAAPADLAVLLDALADASWRVRAAAVERLGALRDPAPALPGLLEALGGGATVGAREAAAAALQRLGGAAVPAVLERLGGPDADLRQAAAGVLGAIGDRRGVPALAARLADADPNVRAAAAEALGRLGGPEAAGALTAALASDDATLRLAALEALGDLRACPPAALVAGILPDPALRRPAYRALGACDEPEGLRLLARGLAEPARGARQAALAGVGLQVARDAPGALTVLAGAVGEVGARDSGVADACAAAIGGDDPLATLGAIAALGWLGGARHVGALLRAAEDERLRPLVEDALERLPAGAELRAALAEALGGQGPVGRLTALAVLARLGSPAALETVVREASDPGGFLQAEAVAALGRLGDARAVAPLAGLLGDDDPAVAAMAANALARIGLQSAACAAAVRAVARARAAVGASPALYRILGALGEAEDLPRVCDGLRGAAPAGRAAAAAALASLGRRGAAPAGAVLGELAAVLRDGDWQVRAAAAAGCAEVVRGAPGAPGGAAPAVRDALAAALGDPEPAVRAAAAEALGAAGAAEQAPALAALGRDPASPPAVVVAALHALSGLGAPPADLVAAAVRHADPEVAKEGVAAAARLAGPEGARLLREAAGSARWDVRRAAAGGMAVRGDPALAPDAARLAAGDPDPLVARAFADAARALGAG
ncbi:HEAT repeat domain-containing protein [Anaeromyxobacter dehalogenans]|uniref:PBS lyase HEAT-like repeat protein n=1 Tax=Anaeromyxobacter dehalogenans (strain 2CP-C) TaxID=290397 RepID=Q2ILH5_ANADE|nr:HEAT repeat domain-containing protein [Anaeromyxobacter dehalogenans]ABC82502.1 PBS lyase HEAT-like repeat protein [Anaeromyxobacter dehalogenans 2CP-C]